MAVQSRSRAPRSSETSSAKKASAAVSTAKQTQPQPSNNLSKPAAVLDDVDGPPAKKRKLSIRSKQTTLDHYTKTSPSSTAAANAAVPAKPPTRVSVAQPHGRLVQNLNGVQTLLDTHEDELSQPASGMATPKPKRVPKPAALLVPQPRTEPPKQEDKRTLRSQDEGPRLKSELSIYFPNYEEIIFDAPKEPDFITVDSTLYVTDDTAKTKAESISPKAQKIAAPNPRKSSINGVPPSPSNQFNGSPSLNLEIIARSLPKVPEDPLTDEHFLKFHRRAERKEKQLRNIEKERAMHEKVQLDRILEGLQGHDWLKVLGITGITDSEAKKFEPKRDYFIQEVKALVEKFKLWKEMEKRRKVEKETPVRVIKEEEEEEEEVDWEGLRGEESSTGPPSSDLNASAARQLQQETAIALKSVANAKPNTAQSTTSSAVANHNNKSKDQQLLTPAKSLPPPLPPPPPPPPEEPITSFYTKAHLRDAALGKSRHGRNVTAFGHPVPDMPESRDFELPGDIVSEEAIRANAREKRRRKRERDVDGSG